MFDAVERHDGSVYGTLTWLGEIKKQKVIVSTGQIIGLALGSRLCSMDYQASDRVISHEGGCLKAKAEF